MVAQAMGAVVPLCLVAAWPLSAVQSQQPISHFDWHASSAAWPLIHCSLTSPCSSVSDVCLSFLCCWTAALSSVVLAARLALSLALHIVYFIFFLRTSIQ